MAKDSGKKSKKKKPSVEERHRQLQDQVQALPYAVAEYEKRGQRFKAFALKYLTGPVLRLMKKMMDRQRYRGTEGEKLKQSEQMKRHLDMRRQALDHVQKQMREAQKTQRRRQR